MSLRIRCLCFPLSSPSYPPHHRTPTRLLSTTPTHLSSSENPPPSTSPRGPLRHTHEGPPSATSTSAAQPFSTPFTPSLSNDPSLSPSQPSVSVKSSVPAGTLLKGIGYLKGKESIVAREDQEYPVWLWGLLADGKKGEGGKDATGRGEGGEGGEGDVFAKSKKQRKAASRAARKAAEKLGPEALIPKVPLEHQSVDLFAGDGTVEGALVAKSAREDLTGAMRTARRKGIKEGNYLRTMS